MTISQRSPIHVVYGGAHIFKHDTPQKLGNIALSSLRTYAPTPAELSVALGFTCSDDLISKVFERTQMKLEFEPVEDFRVDFEDGYGVRPNDEEDSHAVSAAEALGRAFIERINTPFTGIRIKSFASATRIRAERTVSLFIERLLETTGGKLPGQFRGTLPKVNTETEGSDLANILTDI